MADLLTIFPSSETIIKVLTGGLLGAFATWLLNWFRERRSVNSALAAEVDRICEAITNQLRFIRGETGNTIQERAQKVPWLSFRTPVWDGLVDQLGVLGSQRAREVAKFFGFFGFINEFLGLREKYNDLGRADEFNGMYIRLLEDQLKRRPNL